MRRSLLSLALVTALLPLSATTALGALPGGARKAPVYGPKIGTSGYSCSTGATPTPKRFGFVVLNTSGKELELSGELSLKRAGATYMVSDEQSPGNCFNSVPIGTVTTNGTGNGNFHFIVPRIPGSTKFWVYISNPTTGEELGSSAVALD